MKSSEFITEKRLDPEMQRLYKLAKAKYPMYDEETAFLKYLQRSSQHGEETDRREDAEIAKLTDKTIELDRRVTRLEKNKKTEITELFDVPQKYTYKYNDEDMTSASFTASNGLVYEVNIGQLNTIEDEPSDAVLDLAGDDLFDDVWDRCVFIMFHTGHETGITGTGNSVEVLSSAIAIVSEYVKKFKPGYIAYHAREASRQKLYQTICTRVGFKPISNDGQYFLWKR